jgi:hypothetical protein
MMQDLYIRREFDDGFHFIMIKIDIRKYDLNLLKISEAKLTKSFTKIQRSKQNIRFSFLTMIQSFVICVRIIEN